MTVDPLVRDVAGAYLSLTDSMVPGFVQGFYLTGSVALGDFRPRHSDIDFLAVSALPPTPAQAGALAEAHARLASRHPRPFLDGPYVTWDELATDPSQAAPGPYAHRGRLLQDVTHGRHPATWQTLSAHGVTLRGPHAQDLTVDTAPGELLEWAHDGLVRYWRPWQERGSRFWSQDGLALLRADSVAWGVLGVSRLHHTLATGGPVSMTAAGEYARTVFGPSDPRWERIAAEAVRIRTGAAASPYRGVLGRRADALAFVDMVVRDALRR